MEKKGEFQECLEHYLRENGPKDLAEFCQMDPRNVKAWLNGSEPKGLSKVKVIIFLTAKAGYQLTGYEPTDSRYQLMAVLAFDLLTPDGLAWALGFVNYYDAYRFLFASRPCGADKKEKANVLAAQYKQQLAALLKGEEVKFDHASFVDNFSSLTQLLTVIEPSIDKYLAASPGDRQDLRDRLESSGLSIFKSSNMLYRAVEKLNALCSERSFNSAKIVKNEG